MKLATLRPLLAIIFLQQIAFSATEVAEMKLQAAVRDVLAVAKAAPDSATLIQNIRPVLEKSLSFDAMTRRAIGPGWRQFSSEEQKSANQLFTTLIIRSYGKKFVPGEEPVITFKPASEPAPGRVDVPTSLVYQGSQYEVTYRLEEKEDWRVTDVIVEGVSLVANYRSQLDAQFKKGGSTEVINSLKKSVDRPK